ncbi:hypothetical protein LCGC14_2036140, partial [marine sediment metagenome]
MEHDDDLLEEIEGFIKLVNVKAGQVVLDIATGTGRYLIQMTKSGALCYGIDQSPKMLKVLSHRLIPKSCVYINNFFLINKIAYFASK